MNRRGGRVCLAIVRRARASFAGSPDCLPFCDFQYLDERPAALVVVGDGRLSEVRGLLGQELSAEEAGIDDRHMDAERCDLGANGLHPALKPELRGRVGRDDVESGGDAG